MENKDIHNEKELFERIADGDGQALALVYKQYVPQLAAYIFTITRSDRMVDEFIQETFLRLWLNRYRLKEVEEPKGWTFRITANICHNYLKRRLVEKKVYAAVDARTEAETETEEAAQAAQVKAILAALDDAVNSLPAQRKKVYQLSREGEHTIPEIAAMLGLSPNTVRNTLGAALEQIREFLQKAGYSLPVFLVTCLCKVPDF